jgi:glutamate-1-semialdehyde 2,1-aminomutase
VPDEVGVTAETEISPHSRGGDEDNAPDEKSWIDRSESVFPGGSLNVLRWPAGRRIVFESGSGARVVDVTGREYIDFLLGSGPLVLGHAHRQVVKAVQAQAERGSTFYGLSRPAIELAERIVQHAPCADLVRFCGSGSDAVFFALRVARAATGRPMILKFEGGFHGSSDYALMSVTPHLDLAYPEPESDSAGVPSAIVDDVLVAPYNDVAATSAIIEAYGDRLAAIVVEPVQRAIGPAPGFLESLRQLTRDRGIVLIFDEVVTGFRLGLGGAQELYGVVPDLATYGKAIGGGYPLAAVAGRRDVMEAIAPTDGSLPAYVSGTLSGNPIAAVAGLATLDVLEERGTYERLFALGATLRSRLQDAFASAQRAALVIGVGPIFQILLPAEADATGPEPPTSYRAVRDLGSRVDDFTGFLIDRGILYTGRKGYLSLAHEDSDLETFAETAAEWAAATSERDRL